MTSEQKIKPCPFCKDDHAKVVVLIKYVVTVLCEHCYAQGPLAVDKKSAIRAWNKRAK